MYFLYIAYFALIMFFSVAYIKICFKKIMKKSVGDEGDGGVEYCG